MDSGTLVYYVYRLAGAIAPLVPPPAGYRAAELLGGILWRLSPLRGTVQANLSHIVGEAPESPRVRALARQVYRNQGKNYFDLLRVASMSRQEILRTVRGTTGTEHLDQALARGRGVVLVSAHYGNFDLAGQVLALRGYQVTAVAEHLRPERLFRYISGVRASHGLRFIPIDAPLRPIFRALHANEIVGLALDRNVTDEGRDVLFCGRPARLPDGYLKLALRTGAALIVAFCHRLPDNTFFIHVEPEIQLQRTGDTERDVQANLPPVLSVFEAYLRRHPEQWVYFQPVWPSQPQDGDEPTDHPCACGAGEAADSPGCASQRL